MTQGTWDRTWWLQLNTCSVGGRNWKRRFCWCRFNYMIRSGAEWWLFLNWWRLSLSSGNCEKKGAGGSVISSIWCHSSREKPPQLDITLVKIWGRITHRKCLLTALLHRDYSNITCMYMLKPSEVGATWARTHPHLHPRQLSNPPPYHSFFNPPMTLIWKVYMQSADFGKLIR